MERSKVMVLTIVGVVLMLGGIGMLIGGIAQNANPLVQFANAFGVGAAPGLPLIIIGAIVIVVG